MEGEADAVALTPEHLRLFQPSKGFRNNQRPIVSLGYSDTGELCVTASEDESLNLYDCREGRHIKTLYSKKYGVGLIRFTHGKNDTIYASTKENHAIRYHSLHDNKYIRYFKGHERQVVALEMFPTDDQFMSAALDETVRLWDLRSPDCQGVLHTHGKSTVALDPSGMVFAIGINSTTIKVYDSKKYNEGPFATWQVFDPAGSRTPEWTSLKFTTDGKHILISTTGDMHYLIDAFDGGVTKRLEGKAGLVQNSCGEEVSLSSDARFAFAGSDDGNLNVWDLHSPGMNPKPMTLQNQGQQSVNIVSFNPAYGMLATGGEDLAFHGLKDWFYKGRRYLAILHNMSCLSHIKRD